MADRYLITGGGSVNWNATSSWASTSGGGTGASFPVAGDRVFLDANSGNGTLTVNVSSACGDFDATGYTGTLAGSSALACNGSWNSGSTLTISYTGQLNFNATSGSKTITTNSKSFGGIVTIASGAPQTATYQLADNLTTTAAFQWNGQSLNLNGKTISSTTLTLNATGSTTTFTGGGGKFTVSANSATVLTANVFNPSSIVDDLLVEATYSGATGTRTFTASTSAAEGKVVSLRVSAGTDVLFCTSTGRFKNIDWTGYTGAISTINPWSLYSDLTLGSGMTIGSGQVINFIGSGVQNLTTNGVSIGRILTIVGTGSGSVKLADNATSTVALTHTSGAIDLNGKTLTVLSVAGSGSTARSIKSSSASGGKIVTTQTSASTVFDYGTATNYTSDRTNPWTIEIGGNTANTRTFAGGGATWPTVTFTSTTAASRLNFTGSNTFKSLAYTGNNSCTFGFTAATTTTIEDNNGFPSGSFGKVFTVASITAASHALSKSGGGTVTCGFVSVSRSDASPSSTWYATLPGSTNGGNNTGWIFLASQSLTGAVSFSGAMTLIRRIGVSLDAAVSFSGAFTKRVGVSLSAATSFVGALTKRVDVSLAAAASFSGSLAKRVSVYFDAAASFSGSLAKRVSVYFDAAASFSGLLAKRVSVYFDAAASFSGSLAKRVDVSLAASISFLGSLVKRVDVSFNAAVSFVGSFLANVHRLTGPKVWKIFRRAVHWVSGARGVEWVQDCRGVSWDMAPRSTVWHVTKKRTQG